MKKCFTTNECEQNWPCLLNDGAKAPYTVESYSGKGIADFLRQNLTHINLIKFSDSLVDAIKTLFPDCIYEGKAYRHTFGKWEEVGDPCEVSGFDQTFAWSTNLKSAVFLALNLRDNKDYFIYEVDCIGFDVFKIISKYDEVAQKVSEHGNCGILLFGSLVHPFEFGDYKLVNPDEYKEYQEQLSKSLNELGQLFRGEALCEISGKLGAKVLSLDCYKKIAMSILINPSPSIGKEGFHSIRRYYHPFLMNEKTFESYISDVEFDKVNPFSPSHKQRSRLIVLEDIVNLRVIALGNLDEIGRGIARQSNSIETVRYEIHFNNELENLTNKGLFSSSKNFDELVRLIRSKMDH